MPRRTGGWKLGPYEILALIGAGGMGEVYRVVAQAVSPAFRVNKGLFQQSRFGYWTARPVKPK